MRPREGVGTLLFFSRTYGYLERYLARQVGRSPHTVESYRDALTVFRRYVREERGLGVADMEFGDCTRDLVLSFLERLQAQGCSAGTCNQRLAAIRSYLWYAADRDVVIRSIALSVSRIPPVRGPERIKVTLSEAALAAILSQPDPSTRKGVRDRAMLVLNLNLNFLAALGAASAPGETVVHHAPAPLSSQEPAPQGRRSSPFRPLSPHDASTGGSLVAPHSGDTLAAFAPSGLGGRRVVPVAPHTSVASRARTGSVTSGG